MSNIPIDNPTSNPFSFGEAAARLIVQSALDAIVCIDASGSIIVWNKQAENIFGWTAKEIMGQTLTNTIIPHIHRKAHEKGMVHYHHTGQGPVLNQLIEITALDKKGREFPVELTIIPIRQNEKEFFCAFLRDISARKEAARQQALFMQELENNNKELEQFLFITSHDLQEPMQTVAGFAALFQKQYGELVDEKGRHYLQYMSGEAERMRGLMRGLLSYLRIGRSEGPVTGPLDELLRAALTQLQPIISTTGAHITADPLPALPVYPVEIQLLFHHIIANALKFLPGTQTPKIHVTATRTGKDWQFSICDNGIGIDQKYKEKVFVIFQRLHAKSDYEGIGMGLALCKKIVSLHKGTIWFEPNTDQGCTFYFTLPEGKGS